MKIILVRHGKPNSDDGLLVNAADYTKWVRNYNNSYISENSRPDSINTEISSLYTISSKLNRAVHSTEIYTGKKPNLISSLFNEMDIPRYKLPFKFTAMTWLYLCRIIWVMGFSDSFESYRCAKKRSILATQELIKLSKKHKNLVLFGHGYMNLHIRKELVRNGWTENYKSNLHWGVSELEIK